MCRESPREPAQGIRVAPAPRWCARKDSETAGGAAAPSRPPCSLPSTLSIRSRSSSSFESLSRGTPGAGAPPAVKMLLGCRAWAEEAELEEQLRMGLWRLVEPIEGGQKLGAALMRAHETPDAAFALWEALWAKTEQEQEATGA